MVSKLEEAKQKLQFVSRTLSNGYLDYDTLDELCMSLSSAIRLINEHEELCQPEPLSLEVPAYRVTVYEPVNA